MVNYGKLWLITCFSSTTLSVMFLRSNSENMHINNRESTIIIVIIVIIIIILVVIIITIITILILILILIFFILLIIIIIKPWLLELYVVSKVRMHKSMMFLAAPARSTSMYRCSTQVRNVGGFGMSSIDADAFAFTRPEPPKKNRTAPHGGVIFALKMINNTGIYSVLWPKWV